MRCWLFAENRAGIGDWLDELRKAVSRQQIIESPDDYPLSDVITAYLDMRRDGRETWNRYAQEKRSCP